MYSYEWTGHSLVITDEETGEEWLLQGDDASQAHDEFRACKTDEDLQYYLSQYPEAKESR